MAFRQISSAGGAARGSATVVLPGAPGVVGEGGGRASEGGKRSDVGEKIRSIAQNFSKVADLVLEKDGEKVRASLPNKSIEELIQLPSDDPAQFGIATIQVDGIQITPDNVAYRALVEHFKTPAGEERNAKWLKRMNTLLCCASIANIVELMGSDGLGEYTVLTEAALEYMKLSVSRATCNLSDDLKKNWVRNVFSATSIDQLRIMYDGMPILVEPHQVFLISEATLGLLTKVMALVLSLNGQFSSRPYFRAMPASDAFIKRLLGDIKNAIPLISTILHSAEDKPSTLIVAWRVVQMMGFQLDTTKHCVDYPHISGDELRSMVMTFLASAVLMQNAETTAPHQMTPQLFELIVLRVVRALTSKGALQSSRSDARRAVNGAADLVSTSESRELAFATATALSVSIHEVKSAKGTSQIKVPTNMDLRLAVLIHDLIQTLAPMKESTAGGIKDITTEVFTWFVSNGFTAFEHGSMQDELLRLRSLVLPPSIMGPAEDDWVLKLVGGFSEYWMKASAERATLLKKALTRFLASPLSTADEVASVHLQRGETRKEKEHDKAERKRKETEEALRDKQSAGTLVLDRGALQKFKFAHGST